MQTLPPLQERRRKKKKGNICLGHLWNERFQRKRRNQEMRRSGGLEGVERRLLHILHGQKTRRRLTEIHAHFLRHHLDHSNKLLSHFVSVCASLKKMLYATRIFQQFHHPNILVFNSMIKGYSLCGPSEKCIQLFSTMKSRGIWPDEFTLAPLLKACVNLCDLKLGGEVHKEVVVLGFEKFGSIRIGIVELYSSCGKIDDARQVFDEMPCRDVIIWNLMVRGYCKCGNVEMGYVLFKQMEERNVISWNTMISCFAHSGRDKEALCLFNEMLDAGVVIDEATLVSVLPVCARLGEVDVGRWIHSKAESSDLFRNFVSVGNALIDFYSKCGDLGTAFVVFRDMPKRNVVSWNALIAGLAFNGQGEIGVRLFEDMVNEGFNPNASTFVSVLACCVHAGLLQRGKDLFASMNAEHGVKPQLEHYGCVVDLLGRSGCLKEAFDLIETMPMKPNAALWGALLGASRTHGDMLFAEYAVKELIKLEPWNSGNYVLLSNIYAERGDWDEVERMRVFMKENSVKKSPGHSMIG